MLMERKLKSFSYALKGLGIAWREEPNFKIQIMCAAAALLLAWYLGVSRIEFIVIVFLIGFVLSAEALNTALEEFCDMVRRSPDPHIAKIKDLAASAVLIASVTALVVGALIFIPYGTALFS
jgi:diacylglycerol kinase